MYTDVEIKYKDIVLSIWKHIAKINDDEFAFSRYIDIIYAQL